MRVLPVYVQQLVARLAHLLQRGAAPVDEAARTPPGIQHAPQQAHSFVSFQFLIDQPCLQLRQSAHIKLGGDFGAIAAAAHHASIAPFTQRQRQRIDQYRFARAGLAGQRGESRGEFQFQRGDDDEIADGQKFQHDSLRQPSRAVKMQRTPAQCRDRAHTADW